MSSTASSPDVGHRPQARSTRSVPIATLTLAVRDFYLDRVVRGLPAEKPRARMAQAADLTKSEIQRLILEMPFREFVQRGFLDYGRDVSRLRLALSLWKRLTEDRQRLHHTTQQVTERYYASGEPESL